MEPGGLCAIENDPLNHTPEGPQNEATYPRVRPPQAAGDRAQHGGGEQLSARDLRRRGLRYGWSPSFGKKWGRTFKEPWDPRYCASRGITVLTSAHLARYNSITAPLIKHHMHQNWVKQKV